MAAEDNDPDAQFRLGLEYEAGTVNVEQDYAEAVKWIEKSAQQRYAPAQFFLGQLLAKEESGRPRDIEEAIFWYAEAIRNGISEARGYLQALLYDINFFKIYRKVVGAEDILYYLGYRIDQFGVLQEDVNKEINLRRTIIDYGNIKAERLKRWIEIILEEYDLSEVRGVLNTVSQAAKPPSSENETEHVETAEPPPSEGGDIEAAANDITTALSSNDKSRAKWALHRWPGEDAGDFAARAYAVEIAGGIFDKSLIRRDDKTLYQRLFRDKAWSKLGILTNSQVLTKSQRRRAGKVAAVQEAIGLKAEDAQRAVKVIDEPSRAVEKKARRLPGARLE